MLAWGAYENDVNIVIEPPHQIEIREWQPSGGRPAVRDLDSV